MLLECFVVGTQGFKHRLHAIVNLFAIDVAARTSHKACVNTNAILVVMWSNEMWWPAGCLRELIKCAVLAGDGAMERLSTPA